MKDEVVVVTELAGMELLTAHRTMVERTAAETMIIETWTIVHTHESMAVRKASMSMTTHLKSKVQRSVASCSPMVSKHERSG